MEYSNNLAESRLQKKKIYNEFFVMLVVGLIISFYMLYSNSIIASPTLKASDTSKGFLIFQGFYIGAALVAGWKALNRITPNIFLFLPIIGWVVYFVLKIFLSGVIGVFLLPIRLFLNIRKLYLLKKNNHFL